MKNLTLLSVFLVLCLVSNSRAAEEALDFSGDWMFNAGKSDPPRRTVIGQAKDAGRGGMRADGRIAGGMGGGGTAGMGGARAGGMGGGGTAGAGGARAGGMGGARAGGMGGGGTAGMGGAGTGGMGGGGTAGMGGARAGGMGGARPGMMGGQVPNIGMGTATVDAESQVAPDMPWTIELTGKRLRIMNTHAVNGNYIPNLESYLLDGKSHEERTPDVDGEVVKTTKASLKKNKIEIEVKVFDAQGNRSITRKELELSKDGQTLTVQITQELKYLLTSEKKVLERR